MKLAKTIRFDASDTRIFAPAAQEGHWAISGSFSFSGLRDDEIKGKVKQAFSNGFLSVPDFGYSTFVSVAQAKDEDIEMIRQALATHFITAYNAPSRQEALAAADAEIHFMAEICADHKTGTLLSLSRQLDEHGIKEQFRAHAKAENCAEQKLWQMVDDDDTELHSAEKDMALRKHTDA